MLLRQLRLEQLGFRLHGQGVLLAEIAKFLLVPLSCLLKLLLTLLLQLYCQGLVLFLLLPLFFLHGLALTADSFFGCAL